MDTRYFIHCAQNYRYKGLSFHQLCDHNAEVAEETGRTHIKLAWEGIKIMYAWQESTKASVEKMAALNALEAADGKRSRHASVKVTKKDGEQQQDSVSVSAAIPEEEEKNDALNWDDANGTEESDSDTETLCNITSGKFLKSSDLTFNSDDYKIGLERYASNDVEDEVVVKQPQDYNWHTVDFYGHYDTEFSSDEEASPLPSMSTSRRASQQHQQQSEQQQLPQQAHQAPNVMLTPAEHEAVAALGSRIDRVIDFGLDPFNVDQTVADLLRFYADSGDLTTTVAFYMVIGHDRLKHLFSHDVVENWLYSYIDLLHRFQLQIEAAKFLKIIPLPSIREESETTSIYHTHCSQCFKALAVKNGRCDRCRKFPSICSVCNLVVKGIYAWCQGCGHGGHIPHMREWYKNHVDCPSGCGHYCQYQ